MKKSPCYKCEYRTEACHDGCSSFKKYKEYRNMINEKRRQETVNIGIDVRPWLRDNRKQFPNRR